MEQFVMIQNVEFRLEGKLTDQQKEAVSLLTHSLRGICWHKVGEGKTRVAIEWIIQVGDVLGHKPNPLIVCGPQSFRQWQDEIALVGLADVLAPWFFSSGMLSTKKGADELSRIITQYEINMVVIDELWMYKNVRTERSKVIWQLAKLFPTIGLSGSMMTARNIEDLYGQAKAVGLGEKLAKGLTDFRQQYTIEIQNYKGYVERYAKKHALDQIQNRLKDNIHVWFPKEMREIRNIPVNVVATNQQMKIRAQLTKEYYLEYGDQVVDIKNGAGLISKLQQVSDGFLYDRKGNTISIESNKLHKLIGLCSEFVEGGERAVVWFAFRQSIEEALTLSKFETVVLSGDGKFDFKAWNSGKAQICFATVGSGSSLNDFKDVRYAVIYSSSYSYRAIQQARGRTNRKDSRHTCCYYYYLQSVGFPDADVYAMLDESKTAEDLTIKRVQQLVEDYIDERGGVN